MSPRAKLGVDVYEAATRRMLPLYEDGHRVVVSFSAGKDSGVALEVCIEAARRTGRLPVDVVMRDEEVMFPGTFEYAERIRARDQEVRFHWLVAHQPIINVFNREAPYWWVFDPQVDPALHVRPLPEWAEQIPDLSIEHMNSPARFPPAPGKQLYSVIGLRVCESRGRMYGLFSSGGYLTKPNKLGVRSVRPIYDWSDADVWRAIQQRAWDYNHAYDAMVAVGLPNKMLRIAPPTLNTFGVPLLQKLHGTWPHWFERVCRRLPGVRTVAMFGLRAVTPHRRLGETWEQCFQRECVDTAPAWIADRATTLRARLLSMHAHHSNQPLPEVTPCYHCSGNIGSWRRMADAMYTGDAFCSKQKVLDEVDPEFFRAGAGRWGGSPSW